MVAPKGRDYHPVRPPRPTPPARMTLLSSVLESLQDHVSNTGIVGVAEAVLGVLGFAGLVSSLLGEPAIKIGAIVATLVAILGLLALLAATRSQLQSRNEATEKLVRDYCYALETRYHHMWRTKSWHQVITIDAQGNTTEEISCVIVADSEFVDYFSVWSGSGWAAWPAHYQRKVRFQASTAMNGSEGGVRTAVTHTWYDRHQLAINVHLTQPMPRDSEAAFDLSITWPMKNVPLIRRREPDEFARTFPKPLDDFSYAVELPRGYQARVDTIGLKNTSATYEIEQAPTKQGTTRITLTANNIAAGQRVGMRIDPL